MSGKSVLVTGAGSGIGRAFAARFAADGASVTVVDLDESRAHAVADEIGHGAIAVAADVTSAQANQTAVQRAVEAFGKLDAFVGNAGVFDGFLPLQGFSGPDQLNALFDRLFAVNVKGYVLGAQAALPQLVANRGSVLFTASTAGFYSNQGGLVYTMAKHAVVGLIRELAYELAPKVRVNGVAPGGTFTDLRNAIAVGQEFGDQRSLFDAPGLEEFITSSTPLRRVNSPEDHAAAGAFLISDQAAGITGVVLHSDGGYGIRGAAAPAGGEDL